MAGDWIKWTKGLARKVEVVRMAASLSLSRWDVAGRVMEVWEWADENVTPDEKDDEASRAQRDNDDASIPLGDEARPLIDSIAGVSGFADAMASAGWLNVRSGRLTFPNFLRHNSEPAKKRALASNRKRQQRRRNGTDASRNGTDASRNERDCCHAESVTREEKRREENKTPYSPPLGDGQTEPYTAEFSRFWEACPVKTAKRKAFEAFQRAKKRCASPLRREDESPAEFLSRRMGDYGASVAGKEAKFVKHPATWLNGGCWDDEIESRLPTPEENENWSPY